MRLIRTIFLFKILFFFAAHRVIAELKVIPEISGLEHWRTVTSEPIAVDPIIYTLCVPPPEQMMAREKGPHKGRYIRVRINDKGETTFFGDRSKAFPTGSVIVKEKLPSRDSKVAESLGVMMKTENGWEFAYQDAERKVFRGKHELDNCYTCHSKIEQSDQVFRTYLQRRNLADTSIPEQNQNSE